MGTGASLSRETEVKSAKTPTAQGWAMTDIETAAEAAGQHIIKRPRLTRLLDGTDARVLMLIAPAGFGKTTLAREWVADRQHVWYRGTTATADVAALAAGLAANVSELIPDAGVRMVHRMRATGTPEQDVDILAELFAEDLGEWPDDRWLVFDDYQFAMEARAPERFVDLVLRNSPVKLLVASRKRPTWATARRLLYGEVYELGRNELAMDHEEAAAVLAHRKDAAGLVALAEGWPAVIGLAALTEDFTLPEGTLPDALYGYFAEELYQAASPEVQDGLCRLALAPTLAEGVAEFLLGDDAPAVIAEGVRLGFLGVRAGALELHPLLRTFLDTKTRERTSGNKAAAEALAGHLAELGLWDDAFTLVDRFFSESLFVSLLESGLSALLEEVRLPTLTRWLELARSKRIDAPIVDLAEAEISFHRGERQKAEALAVRAARRFGTSHPMLSRAFYLAGLSAHLDYYNVRAGSHCDRALESAVSLSQKRDAVWGQLSVSLDLDSPNSDDLLASLIELDDGSAVSEVRLAIAQFQFALRRGTLLACVQPFDSASHVVDRVTDPHLRSSFFLTYAGFLGSRGQYSQALIAAERCESYARDYGLPFAIPFAKRIRAIAELGLRHFSRCRQLIDRLEADAVKCGDIFLELEARMIRSRLLTAQGLSARGAEALRDPPKRFPFEGERGEYLVTLALALACSGDADSALRLTNEAEAISTTVEVRVLGPCNRAIVALQKRSSDAIDCANQALSAVRETGNVDSFVVAYRGYPDLLRTVTPDPKHRDQLEEIVEAARDWRMADSTLARVGRQRSQKPLSERESGRFLISLRKD
jgi:hypothetical protein